MLNETRHIDLHLPKGWNFCTTEELEQIAGILATHTLQADRYHPFSWLAVKVEMLFAINHLSVLPASPSDSATYLVRFTHSSRTWWWRLFSKFRHDSDNEPFEMSTEMVHALIAERLSWVDDDKADPLLRVPYPTLKLRKSSRFSFHTSTLQGPTPLLDGYTWMQYRHLQDYMQEYVKYTNMLSRLSRFNREQLQQYIDLGKKAEEARNAFLAILFRPEDDDKDDNAPSPLSPTLFTGFDPIKWQVILFWWSGLMRYLQQKYPHCYKTDKPSKRTRRSNPLELYVRTTATIEKYIGLNEEEVNRQSFHVILQHLEDMARESEETERLNRKYKSKK